MQWYFRAINQVEMGPRTAGQEEGCTEHQQWTHTRGSNPNVQGLCACVCCEENVHSRDPEVKHRLKMLKRPKRWLREVSTFSLEEEVRKVARERGGGGREEIEVGWEMTSALPTVLFPGTRPSSDARCTYFHKGEGISYILGLLLIHIYAHIVNLVQ